MDRSFYKNLLLISLPIAFQNMISYGVNMADTLMLGRLGEEVLSASSLAGQVFFLFSLFIGGIASGAGVLCSQYYGKEDLHSLRKVTAILLKLSAGASLLFVGVLLFFPSQVMGLFTPEAAVIAQGAAYFRVVAVSYLFYGITTTFLMVLRSIQDVTLSIRVYGVSLLVNIFFNYLFIYGKLGAPELGIVGAAVGTVIARGVELLLVLAYLRFREQVLRFRLKMVLWFDRELMKDMVRYGLPVTLGELFWGLGVSVHSAILGHMGAVVVAANSICNVLHQLMMSLVQGIGSAASVMIGNMVGAREYEEARKASWILVRIFAVCGLVTGGLLLLVMEPFFTFYSLTQETLALARQFMVVYGVITAFRSVAGPTLCGIFWGSGDTRFSAAVDMTFLWCLVPVGAAAAFLLHLNPALVLLILRLESPLKMLVALVHLHRGRWIKEVTR